MSAAPARVVAEWGYNGKTYRLVAVYPERLSDPEYTLERRVRDVPELWEVTLRTRGLRDAGMTAALCAGIDLHATKFGGESDLLAAILRNSERQGATREGGEGLPSFDRAITSLRKQSKRIYDGLTPREREVLATRFAKVEHCPRCGARDVGSEVAGQLCATCIEETKTNG